MGFGFTRDFHPSVHSHVGHTQATTGNAGKGPVLFDRAGCPAFLPYLQPFADANKRVSRLAANLPLLRHNLCPLSFVDMPQEDYIKALLAVYELNRIEYLREVFVWAYERSCARYSSVRARLGAPDPFLLQHRATIGELVAGVVRQRLDKAAAVKWIDAQAAARVAAGARPRLAAAVESELCALHEGSILRFRLRPAEYHAWKLAWGLRRAVAGR